jgi:hypothetical protein
MNISVANGGAEEPQRGEQYKPPSPTGHFEQRRVQGDRPTGQALSDARDVEPSNLFIDNETGLFVVHGPREKCISSFRMVHAIPAFEVREPIRNCA